MLSEGPEFTSAPSREHSLGDPCLARVPEKTPGGKPAPRLPDATAQGPATASSARAAHRTQETSARHRQDHWVMASAVRETQAVYLSRVRRGTKCWSRQRLEHRQETDIQTPKFRAITCPAWGVRTGGPGGTRGGTSPRSPPSLQPPSQLELAKLLSSAWQGSEMPVPWSTDGGSFSHSKPPLKTGLLSRPHLRVPCHAPSQHLVIFT